MKTKNQDIIAEMRKGNAIVIKNFYERNLPYIQQFVLKNKGVKEDAEDLIQEAMISLYEKIKNDDFDLRYSIHAYFFGICKNTWRNKLRKRKELCSFDYVLINHTEEKCSILANIEKENRNLVFENHFSQLHKTSKQVWKLSFEGQSTREIALQLKCSEGSIRKRKSMAKKTLLQKMQKDPIYLELIA